MKEKEKCTMKAEDSSYGPVADNHILTGSSSGFSDSLNFAEPAILSICSASEINIIPSLVSETLLLVRTKSFTPSSSSKEPIWWLTAG